MALAFTLLVSPMYSVGVETNDLKKDLEKSQCVDSCVIQDDLLLDRVKLLLDVLKEAQFIRDKFVVSRQPVSSSIDTPPGSSGELEKAIENFNFMASRFYYSFGDNHKKSRYESVCLFGIPLAKRVQAFDSLKSTILDEIETIFGSIPVEKTQWIVPREAIKTSILGAAIGDAMGMPTEFIDNVDDILTRYPHCLKSFDDFKEEDFHIKNGEKIARYTDDTAMAKIVLEILQEAKAGNWPMEKIMAKIAEGFVKDMSNKDGWAAYWRAPGNCCLKSCKKLEQIILDKKRNPQKYKDKKWWRVGGKLDGGCGSVMHAYPFGLFFADDIKKVEKFAVEHSIITHGADIALAACAAMAVGVAYSIQGKDYHSIIEEMIKTAKKYDVNTAEKMQDAYSQALENKKKCKNFEEIFEISKPVFQKYLGWAAHDAIAATVYAFAIYPENIKNAIALGVNTPGDSDSIATLAGALVGAYGKSNIPQSWIDRVENSQELIQLATLN